jgi:hypothetical protein
MIRKFLKMKTPPPPAAIDPVEAERLLRLNWQRYRPYENAAAPWAWGQAAPADDRAIVARLMTAYRRGTDQSPLDQASMWYAFFANHHAAAHAAFYTGDLAAAQRFLADPGAGKLFFGFDNLYDDFVQTMRNVASQRELYALMIFDSLLRLAEATGAIRLGNPETGAWRAALNMPVDDVVQAIERVLGFAVTPPSIYPNEIGLATANGPLPHRAVHALYQVHRLRQLSGGRPVRVCEIGGGLGRTAFYAVKAGLIDYTLVDIPFTSIAQGHYLARTLGPDAVALPGEPLRSAKVRLMTPEDFFAAADRFDIVLNVDSLTELAPETASRYVGKIAQCADRFLSINHEANAFRAFDLLSGREIERYPYWMRQGYVEELVRFR